MKFIIKVFFLLIFTYTPLLAQQDIPEPMSPPRLVNDFAGIFNPSQSNELENLLRTYYDTTSTQIYVVTVNDLKGYAPSDFASRIGQKWQIGQKTKDNGAVILIKPRIGNERGQVFIATGYGLEPILNDARVGRIIDQYMLPYFQEGDYYNGTLQAVLVMIQYLSGEFQADEQNTTGDDAIGWIIIIFIIIMMIIISTGKKKGKGGGNKSSGRGFFPPIFPGGRGGFGGGIGGGFGGGGGGRFGGGGAGRGF